VLEMRLGEFLVDVLREAHNLKLKGAERVARAALANQNDLRRDVLRIVRKRKTCDLDDLLQECTSHTWTQVFLEVDRLSRTGEVCLLCKKAGEYTITLPRAA
jgi:hypothetical protein